MVLEQVCVQQSRSFLLELTLSGATPGTRWSLGILFILSVHEPVLWDCFPTSQLTLNKPEARNIWHGTQPSTLSLLENVDIYPKKGFFFCWVKNFGQPDNIIVWGQSHRSTA